MLLNFWVLAVKICLSLIVILMKVFHFCLPLCSFNGKLRDSVLGLGHYRFRILLIRTSPHKDMGRSWLGHFLYTPRPRPRTLSLFAMEALNSSILFSPRVRIMDFSSSVFNVSKFEKQGNPGITGESELKQFLSAPDFAIAIIANGICNAVADYNPTWRMSKVGH